MTCSCSHRELDPELGPSVLRGPRLHDSADLLRQHVNQAQAQGFRIAPVESLRQPDAGVAHRQKRPARRRIALQCDGYLAAGATLEGVPQGVAGQFVQNQPARHGGSLWGKTLLSRPSPCHCIPVPFLFLCGADVPIRLVPSRPPGPLKHRYVPKHIKFSRKVTTSVQPLDWILDFPKKYEAKRYELTHALPQRIG